MLICVDGEEAPECRVPSIPARRSICPVWQEERDMEAKELSFIIKPAILLRNVSSSYL